MTKLPSMLTEQHKRQSIVSGKIIPLDSQKKIEWCKKDKDCSKLAEALYFEARSESDEGVVAVAQVILNRASYPKRWKHTVREVIQEKWQFSYLWDGSVKRGMKNKVQAERMAIIAADVLHGRIAAPEWSKNVFFYHTKRVSPFWKSKKKVVATVGEHVFYTF